MGYIKIHQVVHKSTMTKPSWPTKLNFPKNFTKMFFYLIFFFWFAPSWHKILTTKKNTD